MLGRLAIVIYWIGLVTGGLFILLDFAVLVLLFVMPETGTGPHSSWFKIAASTFFGLFIWGTCWAFRYIVTGATGISPMAKGRDDALADDLEGDDI